MEKIRLSLDSGNCEISICSAFDLLDEITAGRQYLIVTDENIERFYGDNLNKCNYLSLQPGEQNKNMDSVLQVTRRLLSMEAGRDFLIVGLGGGVICDLAGFTASVYKRGVSFGFVPTTVTAQADASIGGKNGVNFGGYKNVIGVIEQPGFVIIDKSFIGTLPRREISAGFAEIIKSALLNDTALYSNLKNNDIESVVNDRSLYEAIIYKAVSVKASFVRSDEYDMGIRQKLNFGHTIGHALESVYGLHHGEAVSIGMVKELELSYTGNDLPTGLIREAKQILKQYGLPIEMEYDRELLSAQILNDKKREGDDINITIIKKPGASILKKASLEEILKIL